jgi:hypothetical protein
MALEDEVGMLRQNAQKVVSALWFVHIYRWKETDPVELFDDPPFQKTILAHLHDLLESVEQLSTLLRNVQLRDLLLEATPDPVIHAGRHGVTCCDLVVEIGEAITVLVLHCYPSSYLASAMKGELDLHDTDLLNRAWQEALSKFANEPLVTSGEHGIDDGRLRAMVEAELQRAERLLRAPIHVDLQQNRVTVDEKDYPLEPHQVQILNSLVEARRSGEWWVTGPDMLKLPACEGKKISREMENVKKLVPPLVDLIKAKPPYGYRLTR